MTTSTNLPGHPQVPNLSEVPGSILGRDSAVNKVLLRRSAAVRRARYSTIKIWVGAICAGVVIIPVVLANVLPLPDPIVGQLSESSLPPFSAGHLLGTDPNGRDLLSRILHGGQTSLVIGMLAIFVSGLVGIVAGAAAGYFGGWVDTIISRLLEAQMALPLLLMLLLVVALFGPSIPVITLVIAFAQWPEPARITRALVLVEREKPYVAAARVLGLPKFSILRRHVVPNILQQVLVVVLLLLAQAVLLESALSFLGAGVQRPYPTWGGIISDGRELFVTGKPWLVTVPGVAIALLVVGVNLVGDGLRDRVRRAKGDQA
ncbi:peptide/nickel transport system permease protein [Humibacillus xanthopallidus]|uniref:Peptide/nickel transport system permease protein n=1 Tax=Humibacillus xanthopallidus TaxID=412689 RepID=A0A543PQK1_9MICO|nr:ABC transporter permease [Humibacillus xanthopallidus]TQN46340.1 peptide/nickel transport system permease protein [Humibacillus xanthopallidus]